MFRTSINVACGTSSLCKLWVQGVVEQACHQCTELSHAHCVHLGLWQVHVYLLQRRGRALVVPHEADAAVCGRAQLHRPAYWVKAVLYGQRLEWLCQADIRAVSDGGISMQLPEAPGATSCAGPASMCARLNEAGRALRRRTVISAIADLV